MPITQSYAELKGHVPFDWNKYVAQEHHTEEEQSKAFFLASNYQTCAVGNQSALLPRAPIGEPEDHSLYCHGYAFFEHIGNDHMEGAREELHRIEERSVELLAMPNYRED